DGIRDRNVTGVQTCALPILKSGARILLHTSRCGCAEWLRGEGIAFESLDALYESCEDFDDHARAAAEAVRRAAEAGDVVYGVFEIGRASCRERGAERAVSRG